VVFGDQETTMRYSIGKLVGLAATASLALGTFGSISTANARPAKGSGDETTAAEVDPGSAYEAVDSFSMLTRPWSWHALDDDTVIVWTTPFQPYLVKLSFPSNDLKWVEHIGLTSVGSRVYAKFDSVQVRGFRYPIHAIYKMSREEARNLERGS
jgi:hypothetical protein